MDHHHAADDTSASATKQRLASTTSSSSDEGGIASAAAAATGAIVDPGQVGVPSVSGWNVFVTGLPATTTESQIAAVFTKQDWIRVNFDRSTGHCKGYAVIEYSDRESGQDTINRLHGTEFHGSRIGVHWAFVKKPGVTTNKNKEGAGVIDAAISEDVKPRAI